MPKLGKYVAIISLKSREKYNKIYGTRTCTQGMWDEEDVKNIMYQQFIVVYTYRLPYLDKRVKYRKVFNVMRVSKCLRLVLLDFSAI